MPNTSLTYFDAMYADPDPWGYESRWYEQRKYAVTLACLGQERYRNAFEPGCSIGVLTAHLAARCDRVLAADFHEGALRRARERLAHCANVEIEVYEVPREWPTETFDLIVLSEVAYYRDVDAHGELIDRVARSLAPGGEVVLVHWLGQTDYPQSGDATHERWLADTRFRVACAYRDHDFRLEVLKARSD
jgi:SAM-dependent methyltransferase